jgi:hypothetical protein
MIFPGDYAKVFANLEPVSKEEQEREQELTKCVRNLDYKFCGIGRNHFSKYARRTEDNPDVLTLDNHVPHCSLEALPYCIGHHIALLSLPPHFSHKLELSDLGFFGPCKAVFASFSEKPVKMLPKRRKQKKFYSYRTVQKKAFSDEDFFQQNSVIGPKETGMKAQ